MDQVRLTSESRRALRRARLFLEKAKACSGDERVDFEAFLETAIVWARAELHRLQTKHEKHPRWEPWWESLRRDSAVVFFQKQRNWILKEAPPKIGQKAFAARMGSDEPAYRPAAATEYYFFEDPDIPAVITVERHLDSLEKTLTNAESLFS